MRSNTARPAALAGAREDAEQDETDVRDRRVRQHALEVRVCAMATTLPIASVRTAMIQ